MPDLCRMVEIFLREWGARPHAARLGGRRIERGQQVLYHRKQNKRARENNCKLLLYIINLKFSEADMSKPLTPGMSGTSETTVTEAMLACTVGSGKVSVFSTAMMVAWMEGTAVDVVQAHLEEGQTTVGTGITISHVAATPLGMRVHFAAELTAVSANGKGLSFKVAAYDEAGLIGEGTHERVVINKEKFENRTREKAKA